MMPCLLKIKEQMAEIFQGHNAMTLSFLVATVNGLNLLMVSHTQANISPSTGVQISFEM